METAHIKIIGILTTLLLLTLPARVFAGPHALGSGFDHLGQILLVYIAIGLSACSGSIAGVIISSKKKHCTRGKITLNNLKWTFVAILVLGTAGIILARVIIDTEFEVDFLIAFIIFSLLAIICGQIGGHVGMWLFKGQFVHKYKRLIVGLCGVFVGIGIVSLTESLLSGLISGVIASVIVKLLYGTSINKQHTNIVIYLLSGLLVTGMYSILGIASFWVAVLLF